MKRNFLNITLLAATIGLCCASCVTFSPSMLHVDDAPIENRLYRLTLASPQIHVGNVTTIKAQQYDFTLFQREMENNLMDLTMPEDYGSVEMVHISTSRKEGWAFFCISCFTCYIPNLIGFPILAPRVESEYEFRIYDVNGAVVAKYNYFGKSSTVNGLYYGKSDDVLRVEIVKEVLDQLHADISKDAPEINARLEKAKASPRAPKTVDIQTYLQPVR